MLYVYRLDRRDVWWWVIVGVNMVGRVGGVFDGG